MTTPKDGDTIVVWFSCGTASAVAAKMVVANYGQHCNVRVVNNFIAEEDDDNRRFLADVERWVGFSFERASSSKFPSGSCNEVWEKRGYMSGVHGAPCTFHLKKQARHEWEDRNQWDWLVMGYTAEEQDRHDGFVLTERPNLLPVLIDARLTKADCAELVTGAGIELPLMYRLGFPNANCVGCVKASSPTYWNHVRKHFPHVFEERAILSRKLGCTLVRHKGKRIYLDELPQDAVGKPMKSLPTIECGIFCEEQPILKRA